jgi:carbonic anhydrase
MAGEDWADDNCGVGFKQSPIEIPVTDGTDAEGANTSTSDNQGLISLDATLALSLTWYSSSTTTYFQKDLETNLGLRYYYLKSSHESKNYMQVTKSTTDDAGETTTSDVVPKVYLDSIIFRSPSEHTLNGKQMDLEIQYYYENSTGAKAALAVFYDDVHGEDASNALVTKLLDITSSASVKFNSASYNGDLGDNNEEFVVYDGTYTNPRLGGKGDEVDPVPCAGDLTWVIYSTVQSLSADQSTEVRDLWENNAGFTKMDGYGNNRKLQEPDGRRL